MSGTLLEGKPALLPDCPADTQNWRQTRPKAIKNATCVAISLVSSRSSENMNSSYQQLSSITCIRLFGLNPAATTNTPLRGELREVELSEAEDTYEALSYVWGDERSLYDLRCNDKSFSILRNLEEALRHLRKRDQIRWLWIDFICINQNDDIEKSHQVQQMGKIFRSASRALIWLGKYGQGTASAFAMLKWLAAMYKRLRYETAKEYPRVKHEHEGMDVSRFSDERQAYFIQQSL